MARQDIYALSGHSAAELRAYLGRIEPNLRTDPNADRVRQTAKNLADKVCNRRITPIVTSLTQGMPFRPFQPGPATAPARTEAFDAAIEQIISLSNDTIAELERFERDLADNEDLEPEEYRRRILGYLLQQKRGDYPGTTDIYIALAIPFDDMMESLETLETERSLEAIKSSAHPPSWRVELTARGRNIAKGREPQTNHSQPAVVFNQHFNNSTIANAGFNSGTINQHFTTFPTLPADVREALRRTEGGEHLVSALDEQMRTQHPQRSVLHVLVSGIKTIIEGGNVATEVATHGHEWILAAQHWLSAIHT